MLDTILDAQSQLEAEGLYVSRGEEKSLFIAASFTEAESGIKLSGDACTLILDAGRWVVVFPADGMATYEIQGPLCELVDLVKRVYKQLRSMGCPLKDAVKKIVTNAEQFLLGGPELSGKDGFAQAGSANGGLVRPHR